MSKSSPSCSRFARSAQIATIVPAGKVTPRCSSGAVQILAVNGVIGSALSTSSTARGVRPGCSHSSSHWRGCSANSRIACDSCACVVSMPPAMTFSTRLTHSAWDSRSPPVLRGQQGGEQVVARLRPPPPQQRLDVGVDLGDRALHLGHLAAERADVELPLHQAGPLVQPRRVAVRGAEHRGDGERRVGLGDRGDEVAGR